MKSPFFPSGLQLHAPALAALFFLLAVAMSMAYMAGVMHGRAPVSDSQAVSAAKRDNAGTPADGVEAAAVAEGKRVLAPEELHFVNALRNDTAAAARQQDARAQSKPAVAPIPLPENLPESAPGNAAGQTVVDTPQVLRPPKGVLFDYVFQVAAFKDEDSVDSLRQRLEGRGLRTRMQREGKMLLVLVLLRGEEVRAAEVPKLMEEMRLGVPVIRSKKLVPNP